MQQELWTSDLHFHHDRIQAFTGRPWDVEEQTEVLIELWNKQVAPTQNVYHLGDFCFGEKKGEKAEKIIKRLNGRIGLILGNHDKDDDYFNILLNCSNVQFVEYYKEIKLNRRKITMCHFPLVVWRDSHHGSWSLHGHCHGSYQHPGRALDVGLDNAIKVLGEYRFFNFDDLQAYFKDREPWCPDHHNRRTT